MDEVPEQGDKRSVIRVMLVGRHVLIATVLPISVYFFNLALLPGGFFGRLAWELVVYVMYTMTTYSFRIPWKSGLDHFLSPQMDPGRSWDLTENHTGARDATPTQVKQDSIQSILFTRVSRHVNPNSQDFIEVELTPLPRV